MRSRWRRGLACVGLAALVWSVLVAACGDRTGLESEAPAPTGETPHDARELDLALTVDSPFDSPPDSPPEVGFDIPDVPVVSDCPDAAATLIYLVTQGDELYSFYPPTRTFHDIGHIGCLRDGGFSMAVDRSGIAYVLDGDGQIHRVHTGTAACAPVPYVAGQHGFKYFGMGFATDVTTDGGATTETLYVEADTYFSGGRAGLARIDRTTWTLTPIGTNEPRLQGGELTGTGAGSLYAFFWYKTDRSGSRVGQLDTSTGQVVEDVHLASPDLAGARASFAVAFWAAASTSSTTIA